MSVPFYPLDAWLDNVALGALNSKQTLRTTYDVARLVIASGVPGDLVECGVYGGSQCAAMARALIDGEASNRRVHLFDSFQGMPAPDRQDIEWIKARHPVGQSACGLKGVKSHMQAWGLSDELCVYHPGWFADTLTGPLPQQIALLRLDADLYRATRLCLEKLEPLVSAGGWIIVDDFDLSGCRAAVLERIDAEQFAAAPLYWQKR